jgi:hypothetical protein
LGKLPVPQAGGFVVLRNHFQSYANGRHLLERNKLHAVAEFIVRYVAFIADVLSRYRGRPLRSGR